MPVAATRWTLPGGVILENTESSSDGQIMVVDGELVLRSPQNIILPGSNAYEVSCFSTSPAFGYNGVDLFSNGKQHEY